MPKLFCGASDCIYNDNRNRCTAKEVYLNDLSIMTLWEGRQHLWRCKQYEMSDRAKQMLSDLDRLCGEKAMRSSKSGDGILPLLRHAEFQANP